MKRSRLGTLIATGVIAAATIILAAPAASARPNDVYSCEAAGGRVGSVPHYEFDSDGNGVQSGRAYFCRVGDQQTWFE
jgi:hypothetical protein